MGETKSVEILDYACFFVHLFRWSPLRLFEDKFCAYTSLLHLAANWVKMLCFQQLKAVASQHRWRRIFALFSSFLFWRSWLQLTNLFSDRV